MTRITITMLTASLLAATGLSPAALAQQSADQAAQGESCQALGTLIGENPDRLRPEWIERADTVIDAGVAANCAIYYDDARQALDQTPQQQAQGGAEVEAAARIVITQPDPEVSVQQAAPDVTVTQQQPQVSVNQGQPDVLVRQTPPNVIVQVPQPIITIEQPAPEIIITMPEPDVAVNTPEPQVEVRQAAPEINVQQGEPQVQVQAQEGAGGATDAQIDVQQMEADITQQTAQGQAQVDIEQQEPIVRFEPAQPNVQVQSQGEPQIRFGQTGEPNIVVRRGGAEDQQATPAQDTQAAAPSDDEVNASLRQQGQAVAAGDVQPYNVADVIGQAVVNGQGQELGTVERIVTRDGRDYVVLARGGFLGFGEREVGLPLDSMSVVQNNLLMRGLSDADLRAMPSFTTQGAQEYGQQDQVEIGTP